MNSNINLKINSVESKIDKLTLYEPIDVTILNKLINSDLLKTVFHNPLCKGYENEKQYLLCYKKLVKNGKAVIVYNKAKNIKFGRVNPHKGLGLFSIRRELRHTLCKGKFTDIDIENLNISTNNNDNTSINNTCPSGVRIVTVTEDTITQQFYTVQSIIPLKK